MRSRSGWAAFVVATVAWWSSLALVVDALRPAPDALADALQASLTRPWRDPETRQVQAERRINAEWDFMERTFLVLALVNDAMARPEQADDDLALVDRMIADTLQREREHGQRYFLMPYADAKPWVDPSGRSLFIDGEIALMLAARSIAEPRPEDLPELRRRVAIIEAQMADAPALSAESYPDEAWTFCNSTALVALVAADRVLGTDHRPLVRGWLAVARERLTEPNTGLLVSTLTHDGTPLDGPEGSSIWMTAHNLLVLDPDMARGQYERAKAELAGGFAGFGWAREWPDAAPARGDVDSGPVVPLLRASPGSSGMMVLAAAAFEDDALLDALLRSLHLAAFPTADAIGMRFTAAGTIGNAVVLYALRFGPLWRAIEEESA